MPRTPATAKSHVIEALAYMDATLMRFGYMPCLKQTNKLSDAVQVKLYTQHPSRDTDHGGISIGLVSSELRGNNWLPYVNAQIERATRRRVTP